MRDKLQKEFGFLGKQANEIDMFNEQFKLLRKLMNTKLSTPLEEVIIVQESLVKLRLSTHQLKESLRNKEDGFLKFQEQAKEQREQRIKELEELKQSQIDKNTKRKREGLQRKREKVRRRYLSIVCASLKEDKSKNFETILDDVN